MKLTDTAIRHIKANDKPIKFSDGYGLFLLVQPNGAKYWRMAYRFNSKQKTLALGVYPEISLKEARQRRDDARQKLANSLDPMVVRKVEKEKSIELSTNSFQLVALEWHQKRLANWTDNTAQMIIRRLEMNVFPWLGSRPIAEISAPDLLTVLRRVEARGAAELAHRVKQICGQVFRYAIATGRAERDPSADLKGALTSVRAEKRAAITDPREVGQLLRDIDGFQGTFTVLAALKLSPLVFLRPGELRRGEWTEIYFDAAEWRIPASRMKMRSTHIVPLSTQSVEILRTLHPLTGSSHFIFPGIRNMNRPMSENTINVALRRLGYTKLQMTGHGFRAMASTILNERGWNPDIIERQLAHAERNRVRAAYNRAEYLDERKKMMQAWSDYLAQLKTGAMIL